MTRRDFIVLAAARGLIAAALLVTIIVFVIAELVRQVERL